MAQPLPNKLLLEKLHFFRAEYGEDVMLETCAAFVNILQRKRMLKKQEANMILNLETNHREQDKIEEQFK